MTFAQYLRSERKRLGLNQHELAKLLGVSFHAISKWERKLGVPAIVKQEGVRARLEKQTTVTK